MCFDYSSGKCSWNMINHCHCSPSDFNGPSYFVSIECLVTFSIYPGQFSPDTVKE